MTFFKHTESWFKGEIFEGGMLLVFGSCLVILSLYFWKFGHNPTIRALIIPFLAVGLLWGSVAGVGIYRNASRLEAYRAAHETASVEFVQSEKERVEGFVGWYRPMLIVWSVLLLVGLAMFHFWGGNVGRAVGLAVVLFGVAGLMVDHASENNALEYHRAIIAELKGLQQFPAAAGQSLDGGARTRTLP
ncbi:MAG: hypothetical protein HRF43_00905 [Phycisphaerae bacterium]|jgi:hypothetical protein